jgi:hypothetical protein
MHVREAPEEIHSRDGNIVTDADEADVSARAGRVERLHHRLLCADSLDHGVRSEAVSERFDLGDTFVAAFFDYVGSAKLSCQALARLVSAHGDDPLSAELLRGEDRHQPHRAIANNGDGLLSTGFGGDGGEPARAEHVRRCEEARDQVVLWYVWRGNESSVRERDTQQLRLCAECSHRHAVHAGALVAAPADFASVVGSPERADDELAGCEGLDL